MTPDKNPKAFIKHDNRGGSLQSHNIFLWLNSPTLARAASFLTFLDYTQ
jgi:hypothetical protein